MALAFKRATKQADEAAAGYFSQFKDYYGFEEAVPLEFDWESAKAVAGESKFNSNEEVLPKSVTIANQISSSPNYLTGMVSNIAYKATDDFKDIAFAAQRKHIKKIVVHFDDKNTTKKGECTWSCEVKDGALHATMHWNFDQYMGRPNYEDVGVFLQNYLDDKEALSFEIEKARLTKDAESGSNYRYFNSDTSGYLKEALGKDFPVEFNWDQMRATPGRVEQYSNQPPVPANFLLVNTMNDGRGTYIVRDCLSSILGDDMGKEAFQDAFNKLRIEATAAPAHSVNVKKDGKTLVFQIGVKLADYGNVGRCYDGKEVAKKIEALL
jgi:hypothetical protein